MGSHTEHSAVAPTVRGLTSHDSRKQFGGIQSTRSKTSSDAGVIAFAHSSLTYLLSMHPLMYSSASAEVKDNSSLQGAVDGVRSAILVFLRIHTPSIQRVIQRSGYSRLCFHVMFSTAKHFLKGKNQYETWQMAKIEWMNYFRRWLRLAPCYHKTPCQKRWSYEKFRLCTTLSTKKLQMNVQQLCLCNINHPKMHAINYIPQLFIRLWIVVITIVIHCYPLFHVTDNEAFYPSTC